MKIFRAIYRRQTDDCFTKASNLDRQVNKWSERATEIKYIFERFQTIAKNFDAVRLFFQ